MKSAKYAIVSVILFGMMLGAGQLYGREMSQLERQVRHELIMLPYYGVFDWLQFKTDGTKITLSGAVTQPVLKDDAGRVISRLEGVSSVVNKIEVLPVSPNDDRIRLSVYRAIYYNPNFTKYAIRAVPPIHIIVRNGDVRLVGAVDSAFDKNIAGIQANGVPGVFSVTNDLTVDNGG